MKSSTQYDRTSFEKEATRFHDYLHAEGLTRAATRRFRNIIYGYYRQHGRDSLPWRETKNPYHILISEIMLQQTQIERVLNKYSFFIDKYPDFQSLARARLRTLYGIWQGLGYNRRALALKKLACMVLKDPYHDTLPSDVNELMKLPFVGQSTAGAVAAFAFHKPVVFIETNIRRVFIQFFFHGEKRVADREILPLIEATLDRKDPRGWYYALMDYGSALRNLKKNPNTKSAHYKRQSPFEGSNRQIRGKVLQLLMKSGSLSADDIAGKITGPDSRIFENMDQLRQEGFIKKSGSRYRMA